MGTWNRPHLIRRAVEAIVNQTYTDWQLIINEQGEGKGIDTIRDLLKDKRITYMYCVDRQGFQVGNMGMQIGAGDIFNVQADDDIMHPDCLQKVIDNLGDKKWLFGKVMKVNLKRELLGEMGQRGDLNTLKGHNFIPLPAVFWTKEVYLKVGDFDPAYSLVQDYDYWLRVMKIYPDYAYIDECLIDYTCHPDQDSNRARRQIRIEADLIRAKYKSS
jgi:glycosyltransferase involved in cell wall biosynthesis